MYIDIPINTHNLPQAQIDIVKAVRNKFRPLAPIAPAFMFPGCGCCGRDTATLRKLDENGTVVWSNMIGGTYIFTELLFALIHNQDDTLWVAGGHHTDFEVIFAKVNPTTGAVIANYSLNVMADLPIEGFGEALQIVTEIDINDSAVFLGVEANTWIAKYDFSGTIQWYYKPGRDAGDPHRRQDGGLAVNSDGEVFYGSQHTDDLKIRIAKLDAGGSFDSEALSAFSVVGKHVGQHGVAFRDDVVMMACEGGTFPGPTKGSIESFDAGLGAGWGEEVGQAAFGVNARGFRGVNIASDGTVLGSGFEIDTENPNTVAIKKYDSGGGELFTIPLSTHGDGIQSVQDSSGNIYAIRGFNSTSGTGSGLLQKFDPAGTLLWTYGHGASLMDVALDQDDNIYICGATGISQGLI